MKKYLLLLVGLISYSLTNFAQQNVGINTTTPDPSAALHVESTNQGVLVPRLTTNQRQMISNVATGLLVFDTDTGSFWFYNGTAWMDLSADADPDPTNELQALSYDPATKVLSLANGGNVDLSALDNTSAASAAQAAIDAHLANDQDIDPTNELQALSYDPATKMLTLSNGGEVDLSGLGNAQTIWEENGDDIHYSQGNVGIGTATPQVFSTNRMLEVQGQDNLSGAILNLRNADESHLLRFGSGFDGDPNPAIFWKAGDSLRIFTANPYQELMRITDNGDLGIGTQKPVAALHIAGGKDVLFGDSTSGSGDKMFWLAAKRAFRAGGLAASPRNWDVDSTGFYSFVGGGIDNKAFGSRSFIGGGTSNTASAWSSFVGGGFRNTAYGEGSFAGGGNGNTASGESSFVGGGGDNTTSGEGNFIGGGISNTASDEYSFVGAGIENTASGSSSFVGGGGFNTASGPSSFVGGGSSNKSSGRNSFAGGGIGLRAPSYAETVFGRYNENDPPGDSLSWNAEDRLFVIGNGTDDDNRSNAVTVLKNGNVGIAESAPDQALHVADGKNVLFGDTIAGAAGDKMFWLADRAAFRAGGLATFPRNWDVDSTGFYSFIGGGIDNKATNTYSFIGGGGSNTASGSSSFIGGALLSTASGEASFVGGGNTNKAFGTASFVGGGTFNKAFDLSSFIGGGTENTAYGIGSFVGGGSQNSTSGWNSFVGGGFRLTAPSYAEAVFGRYNENYPFKDSLSWNAEDRLFVIGNGSSDANRSNAVTVLKNGNVGIAESAPDVVLHVADGKNVLFGDTIAGAAGDKMFWLAEKAAFRAGELINRPRNWDVDSIGLHSFVGGGVDNKATADDSFVGGGIDNKAFGSRSFIGGGASNTASGFSSFVGGGIDNKASNISSFVGGGIDNKASNISSFVGGGEDNTASGWNSFIGGGTGLSAPSYAETVFGRYNEIYSLKSSSGWNAEDRLFVIGNGSLANRSNAVTVLKNGHFGIGHSTPATILSIMAPGATSPVGITQNQLGGGSTMELTTQDAANLQATRLLIRGGQDAADIEFFRGARNAETLSMFIDGTNGRVGIGKTPDGTAGLLLDVNGDIYANGSLISSDRRFKQNIKTLPDVMDQLNKLRGVTYNFRTEEFKTRNFTNDLNIGLIAQEVEAVFPELVKTNEDGYKAVNYDGLIPVLIEAVKEQQEQIVAKEKRIQQLEAKLSDIEQIRARLAELESNL